MGSSALLASGLLIVVVMALARIPPAELLRPFVRLQKLAGAAGGAVCALAVAAQQLGAADAPAAPYPAFVAFLGLYFGPLSSLIAAALALLALAWTDALSAPAAVALLGSTVGLSQFWRWVDARRPQAAPWLGLVGLACSLPVVLALSMTALGATDSFAPSSEAGARGVWLAPWPWACGLAILALGLGRQLLASKAQSTLDLQEANHALAERQQQLRLALDSLGGGRWEWHVATRQFRFDGAFYEAFGLTAADAQTPGLWQRWYARRHPLDVQRNEAKLLRTLDGLEESYEAEFRVLDNAGRWRWLMSRGTVARRDATGRPSVLTGMDVDITEHRETVQALRSSEAKYTSFYETLPDPAGIARAADGLFLDVNPAFCEVLGRQRDEVVGRTSRELQIWANEEERRRLVDAFRREGRVERMPLVAQRDGVRIPGVISARSVVVGGENCFVFVFHDMTEVQRTSDALRAVNSLLQQAGRMARLGAWEDRLGAGFAYWSDVCYDIHGLAPGSPLPDDYIDHFVAPAYRQELRDRQRRCIQEQTEWSTEMEVLQPDGRLVWVRARGQAVVEDGKVVGQRGVIQDIDESKRADQRLRHSEERFSRIFQLMPYPMGLSSRADGRYVDINPAWVEMLGIPREEAIGRTAVELGIFSAEARRKLINEVERRGHLSSYEVVLNVRGGPNRTVLQSMRSTEFDGEPCWLFSVHDITDRKRNEEQVREREELLSLTLSAASLGLWDWNLQAGTITGDERWRAMRGLPSLSTLQMPLATAQWTSGIAPDDIDRITAEVARHSADPGTPFDATWRVSQSGDVARWVRNLGKIVGFDPGGRPSRMLGVTIDVTPQREQEMLLQRMALFDALTGLPNRVQLARRLQECMDQARRNNRLLGVAYLDLDGFKPVNDRLGHGAGDRLLVVVAGRLTRALRPLDCVARLGGDEFVILMPELASVGDCERMLHQVMESISAPYTLDTERVVVTASIGYTVFPSDDADADTLLRHADQAMYAAKQGGRNRFHQFDAAHERALQVAREKDRSLREALANAEFMLYLQPKVDMRSGAVVGAEALARWHHPVRGVVAPGEFLPLLAGTELEISFGEWVVEEAMTVLQSLQSHGLEMPLSINIAAQHLQRTGFADWMANRLAQHPQVSANLVELEITESAALYDLETVSRALGDLRALGVSVSLDDFGTGYSSLTYLRRLPLDTLKIDQSFVHGMMADPGDLAIVQGVIGLARSFGYRVIAEGVETVEQGHKLLQLGCTLAQGYCIARPMPVDDFIAWAADWKPSEGWQQQPSLWVAV